MKKDINIFIFFILYYVIIMLLYCILYDFKNLNIIDIYSSPSNFIIGLFYLNTIISIKLESTNEWGRNFLILIILQSLKISLIIMFINILVPLIFNINYNIIDIFNMTFHLFFILIISYSYISIFIKVQKSKEIKYICLSFFCLIYFFEYIYNKNFLFIPLYKNYICGNNFIKSMLIYIIWLIIPVVFFLKRWCKDNVTIKKS